ncbi:SDR family NAD(P)-dependent oxidoreductase [Pseudorhodobacter sp. E13]|uniref:type I polyketide synthase n=1 Tax=Pseudorhodobacter sp. E13 TaxID=2487931 RepID=UPI000F8F1A29|nr:type I polyketide synthase [Pseudorhodobacter sp. E13]RUS60147.1 SDR family NAD(P)-dependent oxidoreductase [Pseudorhodobacter sp. E13]
MNDVANQTGLGDNDIAIVGMAAHLPGAATVAEYWANLAAGVESIRQLTQDELLAAGESPARMRHRNYVPAAAPLDKFDHFDAEFFGFSPKEAAILDPQHRQFLEVAWEALEDAGHPPENFPGTIGVYGGCGMGSYFYFNLCSNPDLVENTGMFLLRHTGNDKDFLSTRVSHIFNLTGPSINVQTACSTSLVAVHYAAQALLTGECDMALAGGVTIELPQGRGYIFNDGEILSPDGHCHAFDASAQGTVFGSGAGVVVLRRAADAIRDGDHIWAIIKGSAVNNDGSAKAGYLAPSVDGQARAIAEAQAIAGVTADTIDYVECHGTGTFLGDPIEVAALTEAFAETTDETGFCRIGSVKTNIGHLDTAAGVASLIKASLALHHGQMPPSLNYTTPNPAIDFETSPFRVNDRLTDWTRRKGPRRAGVNSLGVGGTNAHAVLEEAPARGPSGQSDWPFQLLVISAKSKSALDAQARALAAHLRAHPEQPLADVAWTLKEGRRAFERRRVIVAETHAQAADLLEGADPRRIWTHEPLDAPEVVFMFPGGGAQYAGMARDLYQTEPEFADWMDRGLDILQPKLDYDIRALWLPEPGQEAAANEALKKPSVQLPLIMITEYALARLYQSWGVEPAALVGHSMGENTAACLAGVLSFEDCIGLVHLRGSLFDTIAPGGMLSIPLDEGEVRPLLTAELDMASVNAPGLCVVSGPDADLQALAETLAARDVETQRIAIDIAAHSRMLEPILARFGDYLRSIPLHAPQLPIISNRTGKALTTEEATSPEYWVAHLRNTVKFAACLETLKAPNRVFMEMGPGRAMSSLAQANGVPAGQVIPALRHPEQAIPDDQWHIATIGRLWACGVAADWAPIWGDAARHRVPLPSYAFQRKQYYIEPGQAAATQPDLPMRVDDLAQWGWQPVWRPRAAETEVDIEAGLDGTAPQTWLMFMDDAGLAEATAAPLRAAGHNVIPVRPGDAFRADGKGGYQLSPERGREGYDQLLRDLVAKGQSPDRIAHFWLVTAGESFRPGSSFFHRNIEQGFYSLMFLGQALAEENLATPPHITVVTSGAAQVRAEALPYPEKATIAGPAKVIPREVPGVTCATLDVVLPQVRRGKPDLAPLAAQVLEDLFAAPANTAAALRGTKRLERGVKQVALPETPVDTPEGATILLTGGFGGIGLTLAEAYITSHAAKIALIARRPLPARAKWAAHLAAHSPADATSRRILALQRLESLGGQVFVVTADVTNATEMAEAVAQVKATLGPIHTVIHAAGVIDDGPLLSKSPAAVEEVFAPKLHGTKVLADLFPDGSIERLVLFSSTSTITGPAGQVDYVAANEYLNAFAQSRRGGKTHVTALNWGIWADVGMAAEVLADRTGQRPAAPRVAIDAPMLDEAGFDAAGNRQFTATYGLDRWVLDGHRTKSGHALIPGTGYLEMMAEAMQHEGVQGFEMRDLYFFRPLDVPEIRATLTRTDEGYGFELRSAVDSRGRKGWQLNAQARLIPMAAEAPQIDLAAIAARCAAPETGQGLPSPQEAHLNFGPRWRVLNTRAYGQGEGLAQLALPPQFQAEAQDWRLHPALMDLATGWAMGLISGYQPTHLWVPMSYARMRVHAPLGASITSWVRNAAPNRASDPTAVFDITLADATGKVCVEIEGFTIRRLEGALAFTAPDARDLAFDDDGPKQLSAAEERFAHSLSQGIRPAEGAAAFARALGLEAPQVIVSSLPLPDLIAQANQADPKPNSGQSFARPDLDSDYIAPRNDIERVLTGFWQDLLGVGQVGVEDDFFALGGHSLIAVRLFAMVRKTYRVDFPISVLFEAPTIAACAALIEERLGPQDSAVAAPKVPKRRFTHLVAMHEREGGPKTPFFLVAGMFGNVLNLRHLAQLIGGDRPFYGLQARGLYGDAPPHTTIPEAAADYIAELRQVQPHGPYLLGGFSGGGLTAWEMAKQLEKAGEEVSLLVLLDTPLPLRPSLSRLDKAHIKLAEIRAKGPRYLVDWARARWEWERSKHNAPATDAEGAFHNAAIEAAFRAALPLYPLPLHTGRTALFRPPLDLRWQVSNGKWVSSAKEYVFPDNDLTRFAPALEVIEVPGDHDSMVLEPNVRVLAGALRKVIAEAEPDTRPALATAAE